MSADAAKGIALLSVIGILLLLIVLWAITQEDELVQFCGWGAPVCFGLAAVLGVIGTKLDIQNIQAIALCVLLVGMILFAFILLRRCRNVCTRGAVEG
jgi:hypothetical protein